MTTSKKKASSKAGEKAKRGTASKAQARAVATVEAPATPVVTTVTFAAPVEAVEATATASVPAPQAAPRRAEEITVVEFQQRLAELGWYEGFWDGSYGPWTRDAVSRFQAAHGLKADGEPTAATLRALGL